MHRSFCVVFVTTLAMVLLVVSLSFHAAAQQAPGASAGGFEVSIIATGKDGTPVADLTAEELRVKDNGKQQKIVSFEKVTSGTAAAPGKPGLYNTVFLDALNTTYTDRPNVKQEILRMFSELNSGDGVQLIFLRTGLKLLHNFADNNPSVLRQLASQGVKDLATPNANLQPYSWAFAPDIVLSQLFLPSNVIDRLRLEATLASLRAVALDLARRPGRKNILWISSAFPLAMQQSTTRDTASSLGKSTMQMGSVKNTGAEDQSDTLVADKNMEQTAHALYNSGVAVYPIDTRMLASSTATVSAGGMQAASGSIVSDAGALREIAKQTGGVAYTARNDVSTAVHDALNDSRVAYVLRYIPSDLKPNGEFHTIKLETTRKDLKFRTSSGYYAPTR